MVVAEWGRAINKHVKRRDGRAYSGKGNYLSNPIDTILNKCRDFVQTGLAQPCLLCAARSHAGLLCPACADDLPRLAGQRCPCCALPSPDSHLCGACLKHPPAFERVRAPFAYLFPATILIQQLKYQGQVAIAAWLAEKMAATTEPATKTDRLIPMPLHPARLRQRGFNQAALLAAGLGRQLGITVDHGVCRRVRDTPPQVDLPLSERRRNIRGAFACHVDLTGQRIALVDDVMTSGASLDELARVVRQAGAASVETWIAARTLPGR